MVLQHTSPSYVNANPLEAFGTAIALLALHKRYTNIIDASDLTMSATAAALGAGQNDTALEWLDQGRCLVWNQIHQLRTPIENLHSHDPSLANRFREVATALEASGSRQTKFLLFSQETMSEMITSQDETKRHAELAKEWNELLDRIRTLPNFSDFLRPPTASSLLKGLPCNGHVVIFNIHEKRCDALALVSGADEPFHIPLSTFSLKKAVELRDSLRNYLKGRGMRMREPEDRVCHLAPRPTKAISENVIYMVLRELWDHVAKPVLDALAYNKPVSCSFTPGVCLSTNQCC